MKDDIEVVKEKEENLGVDYFPGSSNAQNYHNEGAARPELGSELVVWWDEPEDQDPENPLNWSLTKKWTNILTISVISFLV